MAFSESYDRIAKTVTCRPLTLEIWIRPRINPHGLCSRQSVSGTGFRYVGFPQAVPFHHCSALVLSLVPPLYSLSNVDRG
jgi:hypothetical protein